LPRDISPSPDFAYGWLKQYPELTAIAGSKRQLSQDYVYGLWALGVYNLV
jgi:hypothetical protein